MISVSWWRRCWNHFFNDRQYLSFLPNGTVNGDVLGDLPNGIQVEAEDVIVAMIHASAGNWHHFFMTTSPMGRLDTCQDPSMLTFVQVSFAMMLW
jgi:hypothetical protein